MGGISKTVNYKNNRIDIGGHRFFSKSDRVMNWWAAHDKEMLVRHRKSRIYYNRTFFDYPISLTPSTLWSLGILKSIKMGFSYLKSMLFPIKNEKTLEDFFINRFGKELYETFFKSYTHKVWGVPCHEISASWGAQRVKGVSIKKAIAHFFKSLLQTKKSLEQKNIETSLISQFLYPKLGPGQMWERVAKKIEELGGTIITNHEVDALHLEDDKITKVVATNTKTKEQKSFTADYVFSSMPVKDFINSLQTNVPEKIKNISDNLPYRDFITVGLLLNKLKVTEKSKRITDNWIYIQESDVLVGRLQIFNNWSPYMVSDPEKVWIGLEYFCTEGDELWNMSEEALIKLGKQELAKIDMIEEADVLDGTVIKQEKAYPAYFGAYAEFDTIKYYLDTYKNVFFIGRNGMHRYNNQDHSMLSAMYAVDNIEKNLTDEKGSPLKQNIWMVNTEKEYHEEKN